MRRQLHGISSMWNHGLDCHRSCDPCSAHIHAGWCQVPLQQAMWGSDNNGWYSNYTYFPYSDNSWFYRGSHASHGSAAGIFVFYRAWGGAAFSHGSRVALIVES